MGRRQGPSEDRRAAILAAAETVFTDKGYSGASIREIAQSAGVSSALLYWFFPNKAKLFAGVLLARVDATGALEFPPELLDLPPDEFLPRLGAGYMRMISAHEQLRIFKLVLRETDREPEMTSALGQLILGRVLVPLRAYLVRQMDLGRLRRADPDYLAQALMGMFVALALRREILQEPESRQWDIGAYADTAVLTFLQGALLPAGAAAEPAPPRAEHSAVAPPARKAARVSIEEE